MKEVRSGGPSDDTLERCVFDAISEGATTRNAVLAAVKLSGGILASPSLPRQIDRIMTRLRKQRLIIQCNKRQHGKSGWHVRQKVT